MRQKNKLYRVSKIKPTLANERTYKRYKNNLTRILKMEERNHYQKLFERNKNDIKKSWKLIKEIINRNKPKPIQQSFMIDNKLETNSENIAHAFNSFYVNIGKSLAAKIPIDAASPSSYLINANKSSIFLTTR